LRLDGTEIDAQDFCTRIEISHLDAPGSCAGAYVEDVGLARLGIDGRKVQSASEQQLDHDVLHAFEFQLELVRGKGIAALAEEVVPPPVLEHMVAWQEVWHQVREPAFSSGVVCIAGIGCVADTVVGLVGVVVVVVVVVVVISGGSGSGDRLAAILDEVAGI